VDTWVAEASFLGTRVGISDKFEQMVDRVANVATGGRSSGGTNVPPSQLGSIDLGEMSGQDTQDGAHAPETSPPEPAANGQTAPDDAKNIADAQNDAATVDNEADDAQDAVEETAVPAVAPVADEAALVTAVGDSVMLGAQDSLTYLIPNMVVDAKVGRQMSQAADVFDELKKQDRLGSKVVLGLGSNGNITKKKLTALLDSLADADRIVLVNNRVPRSWEEENNKILSSMAAEYDNVVYVDWYSTSIDETAYFAKDGVHLTSDGRREYAKLIADALK
jgi:lysophospholipase L1-like esterase